MAQGLSLDQLQKMGAKPVQQSQTGGLTLEQLLAKQQNQSRQSIEPNLEDSNNPILSTGNSAAKSLGIQKAGQGLATAVRATGTALNPDYNNSINQTGNEAGQALHDNIRLTQQLNQMVLQHVPANDPKRIQLVNFIKQNMGQQSVSQEKIDPGTALTDKEVAGSFGNVGLLATTAGVPSGGNTLVGKVVAGAGLGYAADVSQAANNNQENIYKPGAGAVVGAGLPIVAKVGGAILKRLTGLTTGAGKDVIQRAIDNPNEVQSAIKQYAQNPDAKQQLVTNAKDAINSYLQDRNTQFGQGLSKMVATEPINKQSVLESFSSAIDKFGGKIKNDNLVFGDTALNNTEQKSIQDVFNVVKEWKDVTPQGMDTLRQRIGNEMSNFKFANNGRDSVVLGEVKKDLTQLMKDKIPGYGDILSTYGNQTAAAKAVSKELNLGGQAKPSTQLNMIMKLFRKDPSVVKQLTKVMGQKETHSFLNDISGAILSNWLPAGGKLANTEKAVIEGGAALGLGALHANPVGMGVAAGGMVTASPRIVGRIATTAGKAMNKGIGAGVKKATTIGASKINQP